MVWENCFNSTLVQLKVAINDTGNPERMMFQFYLSSIKSLDGLKGKLKEYMFQFYLSSIKSIYCVI